MRRVGRTWRSYNDCAHRNCPEGEGFRVFPEFCNCLSRLNYRDRLRAFDVSHSLAGRLGLHHKEVIRGILDRPFRTLQIVSQGQVHIGALRVNNVRCLVILRACGHDGALFFWSLG
eukprot:2049963-Prymnesium_polylepis.1